MISLTIDLEDPTGLYAADGRYVAMTHRILDLCDAAQCKATFFTIGRVAEAAPHLIRDIADKGHEVAYHSHNHVSLTNEDPLRFRRESNTDKDRLQQLSGQNVIGFRAPRFSLTPQSRWALDVLGDLGFRYSSSIMPTDVSLFGFPDAPLTPFIWPNGLLEFPLPVLAIGKYRLPYLGGIYLYTMPFFIVRHFVAKAQANDFLWTYTHPYDFDLDAGLVRLAETPLWISLILWLARRQATKKINRVLSLGIAAPLGERLTISAKTATKYQ